MDEPLPTIPAAPPPPAPAGWSSIPAPGRPPSSLTVFRLAGTSFRTWWREAPFLALLGVVASLPMAAVTYRTFLESGLYPDPAAVAQNPLAASPLFAHWHEFLLGWLVFILVWSAASAATVQAAAQALAGQRLRAGPALAAALHRGPYVVGVLVLTLAAAFATACTVVVPLFLWVCWVAAIPSTVLEGTGPLRALARSWGLTRGHRWTLAGGLALVLLAVTLPTFALQAVATRIALAVGGPGALGPGRTLAVAMTVYQVGAGAFAMLGVVAHAVAHHQLREVKEAGDPAGLGRVFE